MDLSVMKGLHIATAKLVDGGGAMPVEKEDASIYPVAAKD
jgi:hypothetical protein